MCRLFGLIANKEVDVDFSFLKADIAFQQLGSSNPSGWGIGYYVNGNSKLFREPTSTLQSKEFPNKAQEIKSKIIVSHVRLATQGGEFIENTHPFTYDNWIFAHNGNVGIKEDLKNKLNPRYRGLIQGKTDSEVYFFWLLQNIEKEQDEIVGIKKAVELIGKSKSGTTGLNFILSNGTKLFALRKAFGNLNYYSLYYLLRDPERNDISSFKSKETKLLIESKSLFKEKAVIVCSEKLTKEENWNSLKNNELLIVDSQLGTRIVEVRE